MTKTSKSAIFRRLSEAPIRVGVVIEPTRFSGWLFSLPARATRVDPLLNIFRLDGVVGDPSVVI